jgi:hypothetical protein
MRLRPGNKSLPVNRCIYCGAIEKLHDEHVVAYAFNGNLILSKASCDACGAKTGAFEQHLCDTIFQSLRVHQGFQSRGKRETVSHLIVERDGKHIKIPESEHPGCLALPTIPPPSFPKTNEHSISVRGMGMWSTAPNAKERLAALPPGTHHLTAKFKPDRFA